MCIILTVPAEKEITWEILSNSVSRNPDGFGLVSIAEGGAITVVKGFGFPDAKKAWKGLSGTKRVFHARIGTSGKKDLLNCHPFACHYMRDDGTWDERWFFHNGTVAMPRFMDEMNDSWHLAQYISAFPTDDRLHKALTAYAEREHSRFTLVAGGYIYNYGKAWFYRNGIGYSNSSALADIVYTGNQGYYEAGLLTGEMEVTSDAHYPGLSWDQERKIFSNKAVPAIKTEYTPRRLHRPDGNVNGRGGGSGPYGRWGEASCGGALDDAWVDELDRRRRSQAGNSIPNVSEHPGYPRIAPWFRTNWGKPGEKVSFPAMGIHDYMDVDFDSWYTKTHRQWNKERNFWEERIYRNNTFISTEKVDGPYANGLVLTMGEPNTVIYGGIIMTMIAYKELCVDFYAAADNEALDGDLNDMNAEITDEQVIAYIESLGMTTYQTDEVEEAEIVEEMRSKLVPRIQLNGEAVHVEIA